MKTAILFLTALILSYGSADGQPIPNASFENWTSVGDMYYTPDGWVTNASDVSPSFYTTPGQSGNYALKLNRTRFARTKFHLSEYPFTFGAYVKSIVGTNDSVRIRIFVYSGNNIVTTGEWTNTDSISNWTPISISFTDSLAGVPDSVEISISSGSLFSPGTLWGTVLYVDNLSMSPIMGIEEKSHTGGLTVFPNPFNEEIHIKTNNAEPVNFTLYDFAGKMVLEQFNVQDAKIPVHQIPAGIYFYEVRDKNGAAERGKLIKN